MSNEMQFTMTARLNRVADETSDAERAGVSATLAAMLRAVADQIDREGVNGMWTNGRTADGTIGAFLHDDEGYSRVSFALKRDGGMPGPTCPQSALPDLEARTAQMQTQLDALMHASACVFPEDVIVAANQIIAETGIWSHANVGQDYKHYARAGKQDVMHAYRLAYQASSDPDKRVLARAIMNNLKG